MTTPSLSEISAESEGLRNKAMSLNALIDLRHKLTANIGYNLYGSGSKEEGRKALSMRNALDDSINNMSSADFIGGDTGGLDHLKKGIALETLSERMQILEGMSRRSKQPGKGMKSVMIDILSDTDRFGRFIPEHQKLMKEAAAGFAIFAHRRFNKILDSLQAQAKEAMEKKPTNAPNKKNTEQKGDTSKPNILIITPIYYLVRGEEPFADMANDYNDPKIDSVSVYTVLFKLYCYNKLLLSKFGNDIYYSTILEKQRERIAANSLEVSEQSAVLMRMFHELEAVHTKDFANTSFENLIAYTLINKEMEFSDIKNDEILRVEWTAKISIILKTAREVGEKFFENCWKNSGFDKNELAAWLTKS